jgi:hypothetical protein
MKTYAVVRQITTNGFRAESIHGPIYCKVSSRVSEEARISFGRSLKVNMVLRITGITDGFKDACKIMKVESLAPTDVSVLMVECNEKLFQLVDERAAKITTKIIRVEKSSGDNTVTVIYQKAGGNRVIGSFPSTELKSALDEIVMTERGQESSSSSSDEESDGKQRRDNIEDISGRAYSSNKLDDNAPSSSRKKKDGDNAMRLQQVANILAQRHQTVQQRVEEISSCYKGAVQRLNRAAEWMQDSDDKLDMAYRALAESLTMSSKKVSILEEAILEEYSPDFQNRNGFNVITDADGNILRTKEEVERAGKANVRLLLANGETVCLA